MSKTLPTRDGRNIDPLLGTLSGEAAGVQVLRPEDAMPVPARVEIAPREAAATYYGLPLLKEPVWKLYVPLYFWAGGAAGSAAALGAAVRFIAGDDPGHATLVRRARWIAAGGTAAGAVLLVLDLGRPLRFLHMMRVFRPSSPMNVGTWILSVAGGASAASLLPGTAGDVAAAIAGIVGVPLAGYTGVLLANTAVPVWRAAARELPPLFVASGASAGASLLELAPLPRRAARTLRVFATLAKSYEIICGNVFDRAAHADARVGRALDEGLPGALWRTAKVLTAGGLACTLLGGLGGRAGRRLTLAAGILGAAGALAAKLGVTAAGKPSARDPVTASVQSSERGG